MADTRKKVGKVTYNRRRKLGGKVMPKNANRGSRGVPKKMSQATPQDIIGGGTTPQEAMTPDFINQQGGVGDEAYGPALPGEDRLMPDNYDEDGEPVEQGDDKDQSDAEEKGVNEPDKDDRNELADKENNASLKDGQDDSGVDDEEAKGFKYDKDKGAWANATREAGYNAGKKQSRFANKKGIFGIIGAVGTTLAIVGAIFTIPQLAIQNVMSEIREAVFSTVTDPIERVGELYAESWLRRHLIPTESTCGQIRNDRCVQINSGSGYLGRVHESWSQQNIETKLRDNHGVTFEVDQRNGNRIRMFRNGTEVFDRGRNTIAKEALKYIQIETKQLSILERRHIRTLLNTKYGAKRWCLIACATRDRLDEARFNFSPLRKLQIKLGTRIGGFNSKAGAYVLCLAIRCNPGELSSIADDAAREFLNTFPDDVLQSVTDDIDNTPLDRIIRREITQKAANTVLRRSSTTVSTRAASGTNPIGWVILAITLVDALDRFDQSLEDEAFSMFIENLIEESYANYYSAFLAGADDSISLEAATEDTGAIFELLFANDASTANESPAWQDLNDRSNSVRPERECEDGSVIGGASGEIFCPEQKVDITFAPEELRNNPVVAPLIDVANVYDTCVTNLTAPGLGATCPVTVRSIVRPIINLLDAVAGAAIGFAFDVAKAADRTGSLQRLEDAAGDGFEFAFNAFVDAFFKNPVDFLAFGARAVDQLILGGLITAESFKEGAETEDGSFVGLGAPRATPESRAALEADMLAIRQDELAQRSVFDRYFNLNQYDSVASSIITRSAHMVPLKSGISLPSFTSLNPLSAVSGLLSGRASAASLSSSSLIRSNSEAVTGVDSYLFGPDDRAFNVDLDTIGSDQAQCDAWAAERAADETLSDPCALHATFADTATKSTDLDSANAVPTTTGNIDIGVCEGYTRMPSPGVEEDVLYSEDIAADCENLLRLCASGQVLATEQVICEALKYDGVYYGNSYGSGSGSRANNIYGFTASSGNYGIRAEEWLSNRSDGLSPNNLLECGGLTSVALYDAVGYDGANIGCSGNYTERNNPTLFRQLPAEEIRPGDFLTRSFGCNSSTSGHVAIAASEVDANGEILVYETNRWRDPVRFNRHNLQAQFPGGWSRFIGPGS